MLIREKWQNLRLHARRGSNVSGVVYLSPIGIDYTVAVYLPTYGTPIITYILPSARIGTQLRACCQSPKVP